MFLEPYRLHPSLPALALVLLFLAPAATAAAGNSPPPSWSRFVASFIDGHFQRHPSAAVQAGRHEFDGRLPDWRAPALEETRQWLEESRSRAEAYDETGLTESERFERRYLIAVVRRELFWLQAVDRPHRSPLYYSEALDPNVYVSRPYAPAEQRLEAFIRYARGVPEAARQIRENLKPPLPRTFLDVGQTLFGGLAKFYGADTSAAFAGESDRKLQHRLAAAQKPAAKAMTELAEWLEGQRAAATDDFALGPELFRAMLQETEDVDLPLDILEQAGRKDLERNTEALRQECGRYAPAASLADCVGRVTRQKPPEGAVREAGRQLETLKRFVESQDLVTIPAGDGAAVAETPPHKRWNSAYIDIPGPYERDLPAVYYVAPPDPAWSAAEQSAYIPATASLLFISAHEVWPGHFLQHLHSARAASKFGQLFGSYGYSEGWAHYSEELMWEAGLHQGDAEIHIGQLLNALLRDVRFLCAIGLHTRGMTLAAAEQMFRERAYSDPASARQQAARGTFDPAYLNYTLGKLMIRKLREDWTALRGGRSAWRAFHDRFLSFGAPPIPLVRRAMLPGDKGTGL